MDAKHIQFKNSKTLFLVMFLLYKVLLDIVYVYVTDAWAYEGFVNDFNEFLYAITFIWALFIGYTSYDYVKVCSGSSLMMLVFNLMFFIPFTTVCSFSDFDPDFVFFTFLYWFILLLLYNYFVLHKPVHNRKISKDFRSFIYVLSVTIIVANFLSTIYYNGFSVKFDLNDIYENRLKVRSLNLPTIIGYIKPTASCITLILITFFLTKRKWLLVTILTLLQLMNFSFGALKSDFFALFLAFIFGLFYRDGYSKMLLPFLLLLTFFCLVEYKLVGDSVVSNYIYRRMFFMPPLISSQYYDFFSQHDLMYWRDSILRWVGVSNPYGMTLPRFMGTIFSPNEGANLNTGIIGDDYAQFGFGSLVVYPLLWIFVMRVWDICTAYLNSSVVICSSILVAITFISGTLFSSILTGGFLMMSLLCFSLSNYKGE